MELKDLKTCVFDPITSEKPIKLEKVGVDDWYEYAVITKKVLSKLKSVPIIGNKLVSISSGMKVELPMVQIGVIIGSIKISNINAHIVEYGNYDLILGKDVISNIFKIGADSNNIQISNKKKESKSLLSIRIHSTDNYYKILNIERFLRDKRKIFNILMIANGEITVKDVNNLDNVIDNEIGIPENKRLQLSWIEQGSIWITLKSTAKALKSLGKLFGESKISELKKEFYEAEKNKTESEILKATRNKIVLRKEEEEKKLTAENIHATYNIWRDEVKERIKFQEELIEKIEDSEMRIKLKEKLDKTIESLISQELFPELINIPEDKLLGNNSGNLPISYEE